ncbi:MAG: type II toxin-antitoxin system PemK/MazF family toxin [Actinomycetota bacterium]
MVARGEVWWYEHPDEERRPFLILTRSEAIPVLNQLLAAPTTRTIRGIPTEVLLDEDDGMPQACVVSLDNISLIRKSLCAQMITRLGPEKLHAVCEALRVTTAC